MTVMLVAGDHAPSALFDFTIDGSQWLQPFSARWGMETFCSMLVGIACGVLGCFVVLRRMALIGDALSHAVLPGVVAAFALTGSTNIGILLVGALIAGVMSTVLIGIVPRLSRAKDDSAIGIVFTAFFAVGIILYSALPRGTHFDLQCFLFGDPLAVTKGDLLVMGIITPLVLLMVFLLYHPLRMISFDPVVAAAMGIPVVLFHYILMGMLSATIVAGLKTTGVILVVAMVITPASAAYQLTNRLWAMLTLAGLFGAMSAMVGMSLAFVTNSPTGPAMVVVASMIFVLCMLLSPSHGVVFNRVRRRELRRHVEGEDVLKTVYHLSDGGAGDCVTAEVVDRLMLPVRRVRSLVERLRQRGLLATDGDNVSLTEEGQRRATEMVRAHRLWESYLTERANFDPTLVHDEAERLEHAHELAEEIDATLGHPDFDPHGEPIPRLPDKQEST